MILVDTSVWIDYFNGVVTTQTDRLDGLLGVERIAVGDLILTEVLQGFRRDGDFRVAKRLLTALPVFDLAGTHLALKSAANYRLLRQKGVTVRKTVDVIIATFCIERGFALLSSDRDFEPFSRYLGLRSAEVLT